MNALVFVLVAVVVLFDQDLFRSVILCQSGCCVLYVVFGRLVTGRSSLTGRGKWRLCVQHILCTGKCRHELGKRKSSTLVGLVS